MARSLLAEAFMLTSIVRSLLVVAMLLGCSTAFATPRQAFKAFRINHGLALMADTHHATQVMRLTEAQIGRKYGVKIRSTAQQKIFGFKFEVHATGDNAEAAVAEYEAAMRR